jgi:ankyrin repeat protein
MMRALMKMSFLKNSSIQLLESCPIRLKHCVALVGGLGLVAHALVAAPSACELLREPAATARRVEGLVLRGELKWNKNTLTISPVCPSYEPKTDAKLILSAQDPSQEQALLDELNPLCDLHSGCTVELRVNGQFMTGLNTSMQSLSYSDVLVVFASQRLSSAVSVCDVLEQMERYSGKHVEVRGLLEGFGKWEYLRGPCDTRLWLGGNSYPNSIAIDFGTGPRINREVLVAGKNRGYRFVDVEVTIAGILTTKEHYESRCTSLGMVGVGFGVDQHPAKLLYENHFDVDVRPSVFRGVTGSDEDRIPCPIEPREDTSCESATTLVEAVEKRCRDKILPLIQEKREGAVSSGIGRSIKTPLYAAVNTRDRTIVDLLVNSGANVNEAVGSRGITPLCLAVALNDFELSRYLLEHQAAPNPVHAGECAPLAMAAAWSNPDMVQLLIKFGAKLDQRDPDGKTPLDAAYVARRSRNMKVLVDAGANTNAVSAWGLPLLLQVLRGPPTIGVLDAVLQSKVRIDVANSGGVTPLMMASREAWASVAKRLIDAGADPDVQDKSGQTALMHAVEGGYVDAIPVLLCGGANVALRDGDGQTARDLVGGENARFLADALSAGCKQE